MIWHAIEQLKYGNLRHPVDGEALKDFDSLYPDFYKVVRNVRFGSF